MTKRMPEEGEVGGQKRRGEGVEGGEERAQERRRERERDEGDKKLTEQAYVKCAECSCGRVRYESIQKTREMTKRKEGAQAPPARAPVKQPSGLCLAINICYIEACMAACVFLHPLNTKEKPMALSQPRIIASGPLSLALPRPPLFSLSPPHTKAVRHTPHINRLTWRPLVSPPLLGNEPVGPE